MRGGFTLVEMVIAMTILAVITATAVLGMRMASGSIGRGEAVGREAARTRAVIGVIERAIGSLDTMPIPVSDNTTPYFLGEERQFRFLTACPPSIVPEGGPSLVSFFEKKEGGTSVGVAMATASPFRADGADAWKGTESPRNLIPGATELSFSYSAGPGKDGAWVWVKRWLYTETEGRPPAAVRVEFTAPSETGPTTTSFVVPVAVGGV